MRVDDLVAELKAGRIRPAYLVAGIEPLLRDDALARISAAVLDGGPQDFNLQRLRGEDAKAADLRDAVRGLPVMAPRRLVILSDPEQGRGAAAKGLVEALAEVVVEVAAQTETVLVVRAAKADRRAKWVKAFGDPAVRVDCEPPRTSKESVAFVRKEAEERGLVLGAGAAERMVDRIGPQLLMLRHELEKASLLAGPGGKITRSVVEEVTCDVAEQPIWDLTDAIGEGRRGDALRLLGRIQSGGAPAPVVLGTLASHFRKLSRARGGGAVAGPPFVVRKLAAQAARYSPQRLVSCMNAIHQTDVAIKGAGSLPGDLALERLVLGLTS